MNEWAVIAPLGFHSPCFYGVQQQRIGCSSACDAELSEIDSLQGRVLVNMLGLRATIPGHGHVPRHGSFIPSLSGWSCIGRPPCIAEGVPCMQSDRW